MEFIFRLFIKFNVMHIGDGRIVLLKYEGGGTGLEYTGIEAEELEVILEKKVEDGEIQGFNFWESYDIGELEIEE